MKRLICVVALMINSPLTVSGAQSIAQVTEQTKTAYVSRKVNLDLHGVTVETAIRAIADQAGLMPVYPTDVVPKKLVSIKANNISAGDALSRVLQGSGLAAEISASGVLGLVKAAQGSRSAQGVVIGKVTDAKSGKGVSGATVSLDNNTRGVITDEDGTYRMVGVPVGAHMVSVRLVAYAKQTRSVNVGEGVVATVDFKLEPTTNVLDQVIVTGTVVASELKSVPNAITVITAKQIEERGITRIDQLFRGEIPGLFSQNQGSRALLDEVTMFSRGPTSLNQNDPITSAFTGFTNPIKTYVDGVELADPKYLSQIDTKSIERIEILTGPQASTIYGSNAINGVMQIFTKRGSTSRPQLTFNLLSGFVQNNFSLAFTPQHDYSAQLSGVEEKFSYNVGGSWNYMGPWTPAKQLTRTGGFGGARLDMSIPLGRVTTDLTFRRTLTQSVQRGSAAQAQTAHRESGWYATTQFNTGVAQPTTRMLNGQTFGLTLSYAPASWWLHEFGLGQDVSDAETRVTARGYTSRSDTMLTLSQSHTNRRSLRYATTVRIPLTSLVQFMVTTGADSWQSLASSVDVSSQTLTGPLTSSASIARQPSHNTGGFVQTQFGFQDRLFFTYGLRGEWNPDYGADAQPNLAPRYGVAYTQEIGLVTSKVRASYGRSTRPPLHTLKAAQTIADLFGSGWSFASSQFLPYYDGIFDYSFANPDLTPEYQQGGEGGLELYFGTRGSLVVTRYNQTVDGLIAHPKIDSIRSLMPCSSFSPTCSANSIDTDGYGYFQQYKYLNIGSIRNQGWELQGSVNTGPFTTRGTYAWTKSRTIGITPKYRPYFTPQGYPQYQPGATFQYLPEHTWALGVTYTNVRSSIGFNLTGLGQLVNAENNVYLQSLDPSIRLQRNRLNVRINSVDQYVSFNAGYTLADFTAAYRFRSQIEGVLQIQNLGDHYTNDYSAIYASLGRQTKFGLRLRTN